MEEDHYQMPGDPDWEDFVWLVRIASGVIFLSLIGYHCVG